MKTEQPKVSVIIPVYNVEEYLRECLDSVVNQTLRDIEIICIDDGSTDNSLEILKEYAQKDNRFIILQQENKGAGAARNRGLQISKGEYLSFLDSDDMFNAEMLDTLYNSAIRNNADISICSANMLLYPDKNFEEMPWLVRIPDGTYSTEEIAQNIFHIFSPNCWNKMFNKNFIKKNKLYFQNLSHCNDVYFSWLALAFSKTIFVTNKKFITYRYNTKNQTTNNIYKKPLNILTALNSIKKKLKNEEMLLSLYQNSVNHFCYAIENSNKYNLEHLINKFKEFYPKSLQLKYSNILRDKYSIPIVFATNNKFAKYMSVSIMSLLQNASKNYFYRIYILNSGLQNNTIKKIQKLKNKYCNMEFIDVNEYIQNINLYSKAHYSEEMYYRILIPEILKQYDKVLYLDGDLVIKADISELYKENITNYYIAAVQNYLNEGMYDYVSKLGIETNKYFNSGVLLINSKMWLKNKIKEQCFELLHSYPTLACPDQDLLNLVCRGYVKYLNPKWNFMWQHMFYKEMNWPPLKTCYRNSYEAQKKSFNIIHYSSCKKPWNFPVAQYADLWWEYAIKSPFYRDIIKTLNKNSYIQNIFSIRNEGIRKVVTILGIKFKFKSKKLIRRQQGVPELEYTFAERIFSVKNSDVRKIITIFGMKYKFKSKKLIEKKRIETLENDLKKYNKTLKLQGQQLEEQNSQINKQAEKIKVLNNQLEVKNNEISEHENKINAQGDEIRNLNNLLEVKNNEISEHENKINAQGDEIRNLNNLLEIKNNEISEHENKINSQGEEIKNLNDLLEVKNNEISEHENKINSQGEEIKNLNDLLEVKNNEISEHENKINTQGDEIKNLSNKLKIKNNELDETIKSIQNTILNQDLQINKEISQLKKDTLKVSQAPDIVEISMLKTKYQWDNIKIPEIKNNTETIDELRNTNKSIIRFGDGEFNLMEGIDIGFQSYQPTLAEKLQEIITSNDENLLIGVPQPYYDYSADLSEKSKNFILGWFSKWHKVIEKYYNYNKTYYSTHISQAFPVFAKYDFDKHYGAFRQIWDNKKITIVTGDRVYNNITYNIFENASEISYIYGPTVNAFDEYNILKTNVLKAAKDNILIFAIGPAGKVLAYEMYKMGYRVLDLGHLIKDYDFYKKSSNMTKQEWQKQRELFFAKD